MPLGLGSNFELSFANFDTPGSRQLPSDMYKAIQPSSISSEMIYCYAV
jgi:hypothetical protein